MKVWSVCIEYWNDYNSFVADNYRLFGVYSSQERAREAAQRAVTGKPLEWCISDDDPEYDEAFIDTHHPETWFQGNVVTCICVHPRTIDVDDDLHNKDQS